VQNELLEHLRDQASVAVLSASQEGTVTGWSSGATRLLAYAADEVMGRPLPSLSQEPRRMEDALARVRPPSPVHTVCLSTQLIGRTGQPMPVFLCLDAVPNNGPSLEAILVTARDLRTVAFEPSPGAHRPQGTPQDATALASLTPRQRLVLDLMARGHSTREIAKRLGRSVKTVETHRAQLMRRLSIHHVPGLVTFAIRTGLVTID
jgi:DNA-binding CsgD family transcriptional regulator